MSVIPTTTLALGAVLAWAGQGSALTLEFPDPATETAAEAQPLASYRLPTGPFDGTVVPARLSEGSLDARAWRIGGAKQSTLTLMQAMRAQVKAQGYAVVFECEAAACGGFDFRFGTYVLPEPGMHVDLGDYRFLAAEKGGEVASILVSRSTAAAFVQLTQVSPKASGPTTLIAASAPAAPLRIADAPTALAPASGQSVTLSTAGSAAGSQIGASLVARLVKDGSAPLDDLRFAPGATALEAGNYASLAALAAWLRAAPGRQVTLVGHTDAVGALEMNILVSRRRADSVRTVLMDQFEVPRQQVVSEGVGYLSPRASNLTEAGQEANRRVEVVVTKIE